MEYTTKESSSDRNFSASSDGGSKDKSLYQIGYPLLLSIIATITFVNAVIIASERGTNFRIFKQCQGEKTQLGCELLSQFTNMNKCVDGNSLTFYCNAKSPIDVVIGSSGNLNHAMEKAKKILNITSFAILENGDGSYCVKIIANQSKDVFIQCNTNASNHHTSSWIALDKYVDYNQSSVTQLKYIDVKKAKIAENCSHEFAIGSSTLEEPPNFEPCHTWDMCAVVLTNGHRDKIDVKVVDIPTSDSCPTNQTLLSNLAKWRSKNHTGPGILIFPYGNTEQYILPYDPRSPSSQRQSLAGLVMFGPTITNDGDGMRFSIECASSVLHSCGLEIVTKNFVVENDWEDCHRRKMTLNATDSDSSGTITCTAFNQFLKQWDKTVFPPATETASSKSSDHAGNRSLTGEKLPKSTTATGAQVTQSNTNHLDGGIVPTGASKDVGVVTTNSSNITEEMKYKLVTTIVGALLGGILLCLIILLPVLIYQCRRIRHQKQKLRVTAEEIADFMEGMEKEKAKSKGVHNIFVLPYDRSLEVPKIAVDFHKTILGSGAFGKVLKGRYAEREVAIKTIDATSLNAHAFRSLLGELKILSYLGKHAHVLELVGAITLDIKRGEVFLILEYCGNGSAETYIREHCDEFVSFLSDDKTAYVHNSRFTMSCGWELSSEHLVKWSLEVACGMEYVSSKNIYHGDLAARNILLTENLMAKVGDFGLSRQLDIEQYTCYVQKKEVVILIQDENMCKPKTYTILKESFICNLKCPLPLKWMAIESLRHLKFSIQSDVWSFGVTMWEFFSLGTIPYPGMEWNMESWKSLCEGVRLERPEFASTHIYNNIMRKCWEEDPKERLSFANLKKLLQDELVAFNSH